MTISINPVVVSLVLIVAYVYLVPILGFFVTSATYLSAHMYYLNIRRPQTLIGVTAGVLLVFYILIEVLLNVSLPHGFLY